MEQNIRVTESWLIEHEVWGYARKLFSEHFKSGLATVSELCKFCEEFSLTSLFCDLRQYIYDNPEPLVLDEYAGGNIFYNGDVHIKKGFECSGDIICGNLKVDGEFKISEDYHAHAYVHAKSVVMEKNSRLHGGIIASLVIMSDEANVFGYVVSKIVNMMGNASVFGEVDTKTLIMVDDSFVERDVKTLILVMHGFTRLMGTATTGYLYKGPEAYIYNVLLSEKENTNSIG